MFEFKLRGDLDWSIRTDASLRLCAPAYVEVTLRVRFDVEYRVKLDH